MGQQTWSSATSDTFTVPVAVKVIDITLIGAGAAGINAANGAGGGGGAYLDKSGITTSPGSTFAIVVGAGGTSEGSGGNTDWNSGEYIAGGGQVGSGPTYGAGGTVSGSGTPTTSQVGGNGGNGCHTDCGLCDDCTCTDGDCTAYNCGSSTSTSSCDAQGGGGSSGASGGKADGNGGSCDCVGSDNCGYPTGSSCSGGNGGSFTGAGSGGNGGSNGSSPGGGAGGGPTTGADGYLQVTWASGSEVYTTQPSNTHVNAIIPSVVAESRFSDGSVDTSFNGPVNIGIFNNPSGGSLSGTTTVNAVNGVATFSDLSIDQIGNGYSLICQDAGGFLNNAFSVSFNITANPLQYFTYLNKVAARLGNLIPKLAR